MRTAVRSALAGGVAIAAFAASVALGQPKSSPQTPAEIEPPPQGADAALVDRGRYLTSLGDCVACHTEKGGPRFAGGRPIETPFGTVLSANLTPDDATGIGRYTQDTFYRALHEGIDKDGRHLFPAFPYNYYTNVTREDSDAIFAYLRTLPVVSHQVDRNQLHFPFNIRALTAVWNWLYLERGPYRSNAEKSAQWNRGAYLAEGLGHCQACHTPRNSLGGPKKDEAYRGGTFGDWFAPDLTPNRRTGLGSWQRDALLDFLRQGLNGHSAAAAEMGEVVAFSTSQMTDADLAALVVYLGDRAPSPDAQVARPADAVMQQGKAIWEDECSACHRMDGSGVPRYFPPVKASANVQQANATTVLHYILAGAHRAPTERAPTPFAMPGFWWKLDDDQIAAVATYARNSWGNQAAAVSADDVAKLRAKLRFATSRTEQAEANTTPMSRPGPNTDAPADTLSSDNGTAAAGRAAPPASAPGSMTAPERAPASAPH
jgi:mono/diheme cytochrome c family protein